MSLEQLMMNQVIDVTLATVANAYNTRYGQARGTTERYETEDSKAIVGISFKR